LCLRFAIDRSSQVGRAQSRGPKGEGHECGSDLIRALKALMGKRRAEQIDAALKFMETPRLELGSTVA